MIQEILTELGYNRNESVEKTGKECMVLLLGLYRETNNKMIEPVREVLERIWHPR